MGTPIYTQCKWVLMAPIQPRTSPRTESLEFDRFAETSEYVRFDIESFNEGLDSRSSSARCAARRATARGPSLRISKAHICKLRVFKLCKFEAPKVQSSQQRRSQWPSSHFQLLVHFQMLDSMKRRARAVEFASLEAGTASSSRTSRIHILEFLEQPSSERLVPVASRPHSARQ